MKLAVSTVYSTNLRVPNEVEPVHVLAYYDIGDAEEAKYDHKHKLHRVPATEFRVARLSRPPATAANFNAKMGAASSVPASEDEARAIGYSNEQIDAYKASKGVTARQLFLQNTISDRTHCSAQLLIPAECSAVS